MAVSRSWIRFQTQKSILERPGESPAFLLLFLPFEFNIRFLQNQRVTFADAQQEFEIRMYLWAKSQWEKEIAESLPNLRLFKCGWPWQVCQFLGRLPKGEQLALAHALLEGSWPKAVKALGETPSAEGLLLRSQCEDFFRIRDLHRSLQRLEKEKQFEQARVLFQMMRSDAGKIAGGHYNDQDLRSRLEAIFEPFPLSFEGGLFARMHAGEKITFAPKRTLMKTLKAKYAVAFGDQIMVPVDRVRGEPDLVFKTPCCGWILTTSFFFGSREKGIEYYHDITSEDTFEQTGPRGSCRIFLKLGINLSFCFCMGLAGTEWSYLTDSDVEPVCENAIKYCREFFEFAPKLLQGLELEKVNTA